MIIVIRKPAGHGVDEILDGGVWYDKIDAPEGQGFYARVSGVKLTWEKLEQASSMLSFHWKAKGVWS